MKYWRTSAAPPATAGRGVAGAGGGRVPLLARREEVARAEAAAHAAGVEAARAPCRGVGRRSARWPAA